MTRQPDISDNDILAALDEYLHAPEEDALDMHQLMEKLDIPETSWRLLQVRNAVRKLIEDGKWECVTVKRPKLGRMSSVPGYRPIR